ncbi:MAG: hypothetical protein J7K81_02975, partial [Methanophagales archaeon]|nr:hypothetical protein [Methanophagales archaeon]
MNKLPKTVASPEMDLEKLKGTEEYIRRQWWDEIRRVEGEYLTKCVPEGETNGFLEANVVMAKLKLVVSFSDNGERSPEHGFKEDQMDRIIGSEIRGDLALAFKRVYSGRLRKMELAATEYIRKYGIGPVGVWGDIEGAIAKSVEERKEIIEGINQSLSELEKSLKGGEEIKEGGMRLEGILRRLEREVVEKEKGKEALNSRLIEFEGDKREVEERLGKIKAILEGGEVKRFVTKDVAMIHELNYIGRFDIKMNELPKRIDNPLEGKERRITAWSHHRKFDDVDKILNLNTLKKGYEEATGKLRLNLRSRYVVAEKKHKLFGKEETKVIIEAAVLGHLLDYDENGFDTKSVTLSELLSVLTRYIDSAELGNYFHVLGIASV